MKKLLKAILITLIAIPFMYLLVIDPSKHNGDFALSDFYLRSSQRMHSTVCPSDVVILSVDKLSRLEIAEVVEKVDYLGARSVAMDVFMDFSTPDDPEVVAALSSCEHLILPSSLTEPFQSPVFSQLPDKTYGYTNLPCAAPGGIIRSFSIREGNDVSFAAAACGKAEGKDGIIRYDGYDFDILYPEDIKRESVAGKIVFVGNLNDFSDSHPTPAGTLPGVLIHAYVCQTILDGSTPRECPGWLLFLIAFLIGTGMLWCKMRIAAFDGSIASLTIRIGQLVLLLVFYLVGVAFLVYKGLYVDFSLSFLMIAACMLVADIIKGITAIIRLVKNKRELQSSTKTTLS